MGRKTRVRRVSFEEMGLYRKEAGNPMSISEVRGIWVWVGDSLLIISNA